MGCSKLKMGLRLPHYWKLEFNSLETTSDPHKIICLSLTSNDSAIEVYTQTGTCGIGKYQMPFTITWLSSIPFLTQPQLLPVHYNVLCFNYTSTSSSHVIQYENNNVSDTNNNNKVSFFGIHAVICLLLYLLDLFF